MNKTIYDIKVWKLVIIFFSALILEANGIASFRYLVASGFAVGVITIRPFFI